MSENFLQELGQIRELEARLAKVYSRTPEAVTEAQQKRANLDRLMVLAGVSDTDPVWNAILSYADEHARNELQVALQHNLSDGQRQFEAGRAASASDWASALRDLKVLAEQYARSKTV